MSVASTTGSHVVRHDEAYSVEEFLRRVGLEDGLDRLRREGLRIRKGGGREFVLGEDWIAFLRGPVRPKPEAPVESRVPASLEKDWVTIADAARQLSVTRQTVHRLINEEVLTTMRYLGRLRFVSKLSIAKLVKAFVQTAS